VGSSGRARRAWWRGVLSALAALVCLAALAYATELPRTDQPLPGSAFQGGDGDQNDPDGTGALVDWESLADVRHRADEPNQQDSSFSGGSEETNPGGWGLTTSTNGVSPGTDNIRDVWAAVDQPNGDTFLYVAFSRADGGGTTSLAFELNRDGRLWNNGRADIPCRLTDDLLINFETQGNVPHVEVRRWVTDDPAGGEGCARKGHFEPPVGVVPSPAADANAQGQLNATAIPSHLGGAFTPSLPARQFGEASLNLSDIAEKVFSDRCLAYSSIWMHSRASESLTSQMKDFVAPEPLPARSCTASGTKFWDANANGVRDAPADEPGLPRWMIWADYDNDGRHDANEPFSITDDDGEYLIYDIRGEYRLRERVLTGRRQGWVCSAPATTVENGRFPCAHGPFDVDDTAIVEGRDFGNWFAAQLTLEKFLFPATDPGRFDLLVDGAVELAEAGNGSRRTIRLPPGTYDVSERAAAGTNPADYLSTVDCQPGVSRRGTRRAGAVFEGLQLVAGARATCTFTNTRRGEPAIAIRKTGPAEATAGDTLRYVLVVSNPGELPIPAATIQVTDPACDSAPELVAKRSGSGPDSTPDTLDPLVDEWEYSCSRKTAEAGSDCETATVDNTATVTGAAAGKEVTASDTVSAIVSCPDAPLPPLPVPPDPPGPEPPRPPDEPGPVVPPGPRPPEAGLAGRVASLFRQATRRCLPARVPPVNFRGTRVARIRVFVNEQLRRRVTVGALQRRVRPRVLLAPGRHRVRVRVEFQRGSATPPVTLSRIVRVCARQAAAPRFTG
jgi:uncharacterized repeat protein (TIGR01451 family)